jgi:hypothetical protein
MGKVVCVVLMAIGAVIFLASGYSLEWFSASTLLSSDPSAFERTPHWYWGLFVGIALILLGLVLGAVIELWPPRIPKPPLSSVDDLPSPNKELRAENYDRRDGR